MSKYISQLRAMDYSSRKRENTILMCYLYHFNLLDTYKKSGFQSPRRFLKSKKYEDKIRHETIRLSNRDISSEYLLVRNPFLKTREYLMYLHKYERCSFKIPKNSMNWSYLLTIYPPDVRHKLGLEWR